MPDEMIKLRKELDKLGVPWEDVSDDKSMKIYRTRFYIGKKRWSVISGSGTYGGEAGLLETWTPTLNGGEPRGFMKADEVISEVKKAMCKLPTAGKKGGNNELA